MATASVRTYIQDMHIKPNRTILEGQAERVSPATDGYGANVDFRVSATRAASGFEDFTGVTPGQMVTLFTPDQQSLRQGDRAEITASVFGGPFGERYVIEKVDRTETFS